MFEYADAIQIRQADIGHHNIEAFAAKKAQGLATAFGQRHDAVVPLQDFLDVKANIGVVINREDFGRLG
jgi:hypothetical protein